MEDKIHSEVYCESFKVLEDSDRKGWRFCFTCPVSFSSFFDFFSLLKLRGTPPPLVDPPLVVEQFLEFLLYLSITYYVDIRVIKSLSETTRLAFSLASRDVLTILIARPRLPNS